MNLQPLARLKIGPADFTPASKSFSMPGLISICAISRIMGYFPLCVCIFRGGRRLAQAIRAKAILARAGCRERQPVGLGRAPAFARRPAVERGAAARAGEAAG